LRTTIRTVRIDIRLIEGLDDSVSDSSGKTKERRSTVQGGKSQGDGNWFL
jgi:hypothetical protein